MVNYTPPNKHTCLFYSSISELLEIMVPYFKTGLENNEFCLWVVPEKLGVKDAKAALSGAVKRLDDCIEKGQILIGEYKDMYLKDGIFTAFGTLESLTKKEKEILERGFNGIRGAGDGTWALDDQWWLNFLYYEEQLNRYIESYRLTALCSYCIIKLDIDKIMNIGINHQSSLVKRMGRWDDVSPGDFDRLKPMLF